MQPIGAMDLSLGAPILLLSIGAFLILVIDVFVSRNWPIAVLAGLFIGAAEMMVLVNTPLAEPGRTIFSGTIYFDPYTIFLSFIVLAGALLSLLVGASRLEKEGIEAPGEYYSILLMSLAGALIFISAAELITFFLGLEIMSMALYCLCGSALKHSRSAESALKYFLLGSFSSAFLLYGMALLYGLTGSTFMAEIAPRLATVNTTILAASLGLIVVGLVFKIGLVPFHFWTPDVYQGAPTPVTVFMACVIKSAAVGVGFRVLWGLFDDLYWVWSGAVWICAALTMVVGNLIALRQKSLKRLFAYSSIGHAGYMMLGFLAPAAQGTGAVLYYLIAYTAMTVGVFTIILLLTNGGDDDVSILHGLGTRHPMLAATMTLFLLALAGVPPGMAGLLGKFYVINAAIGGGYVGISIIAVMCAAVACYYYLNLIVKMYFVEDVADDRHVSVEGSVVGALGVCVMGVLLLGIFPSMIYDGASHLLSKF